MLILLKFCLFVRRKILYGDKENMSQISQNQIERVKKFLFGLQDSICASLQQEDGGAVFVEDAWDRAEGGGGRSRVLTKGKVFEQAGVNFSHVFGHKLPPSATAKRPELEGRLL